MPGAQPDPEQLYCFCPDPDDSDKKPRQHGCHRGGLGRNQPIMARPRRPSQPRSQIPMTPMTPIPNNSTITAPRKPDDHCSTPSHGVLMGFYGLSAILRYILWVMIYYTHIWGNILHPRLCESTVFLQFVRNFFLGRRCDILFDNVLFVNQ